MTPPRAPRTEDPAGGYLRIALIYAIGLWPLTAVVVLAAGVLVLTPHPRAPRPPRPPPRRPLTTGPRAWARARTTRGSPSRLGMGEPTRVAGPMLVRPHDSIVPT